jgi:hypothetical protein
MKEFNPNSNDHLSLLFFGGTIKEKRTIPLTEISASGEEVPVYFKNGKQKTTVIEIDVPYSGLGISPDAVGAKALAKKGFYSVNEEALENIIKYANERERCSRDCEVDFKK